jgi:hypothetical protein
LSSRLPAAPPPLTGARARVVPDGIEPGQLQRDEGQEERAES